MRCCFASDLHGRQDRYEKLFAAMASEQPEAVFLGGDLLGRRSGHADFIEGWLRPRVSALAQSMPATTLCFILGNDDPRSAEPAFGTLAPHWVYLHARRARLGHHDVFGYACIPPSPFLLKDWERYDVSRYVDPGCVPPDEGHRTVPVPDAHHGTIARDLEDMTTGMPMDQAILLFHAPPYQTPLDRAALDGHTVEGVPLDVHIGSIAIRRFIEARQPLLTLHGHVHEAARLTGTWRACLGRTHLFNGAHDGPELALVTFDTDALEQATRSLI